jgi:hypothetical protein
MVVLGVGELGNGAAGLGHGQCERTGLSEGRRAMSSSWELRNRQTALIFKLSTRKCLYPICNSYTLKSAHIYSICTC